MKLLPYFENNSSTTYAKIVSESLLKEHVRIEKKVRLFKQVLTKMKKSENITPVDMNSFFDILDMIISYSMDREVFNVILSIFNFAEEFDTSLNNNSEASIKIKSFLLINILLSHLLIIQKSNDCELSNIQFIIKLLCSKNSNFTNTLHNMDSTYITNLDIPKVKSRYVDIILSVYNNIYELVPKNDNYLINLLK